MSDPEAEQRQLKRRMLEAQLRMLDDEERHSRTSMSNPPVTGSGSYPPQWAATISNPSSSSRHSALSSSIYDASHAHDLPATSSRNVPSSSTSSWADLSSQHQRRNQYPPQQPSSSQSNRPSSTSRSQQQKRSQSQSQYPGQGQYQNQNQNHSVPYPSGSARHHSFRDLDRSSTAPSSSISPQLSSAVPSIQNSSLTSSQTVPLPTERQLHDWLRDCMGQADGLDTDWRINGKRVDIYKLLASVIRSGGSTEVSSRGWWYMLAKLLNLADDLTPQTVKSSISKQLQELFLQMLGGLEILWDKTKGTEEREAIPRTREISNLSSSSTLPTPVSATMNSNMYGQHQASSSSSRQAQHRRAEIPSPQQQHHYVDPSKLTLPPKANKALNGHQPSTTSLSSSRQPAAPAAHSGHATSGHSANYNPHFSPSSSFARPASSASSHTQQSPQIPSQIPLHQPIPSHPPPHRLPDLLTSQNDGNTKRTQTATSSTSQHPATSGSTEMVPSPSQQSSRTVQLRFANKALGEYQVPDLSSFQEFVTSNVLPLPQLDQDNNVLRMTWSSDLLIRYSKRCHELGHSVRKFKAGQPSRQIAPEELVFWAKLLVIMAGNPSVIPPPVEDRPPSHPPPATAPNPPLSNVITAGPPGSFTNPATLVPPITEQGMPIQNDVGQSSIGNQNHTDIPASSVASQTKGKKRPRKSGEESAASNTDTPTAPKKRGRKPGVPNRPKQPTTIAPAVVSQADPQAATQPLQPSVQQEVGASQSTNAYHTQSQAGVSSQMVNAVIADSQPASQATQTRLGQASAALDTIVPGDKPAPKRGRPKGSKTVNRKSLPKKNGPKPDGSTSNIVSTILVPASQPESIPSYSQYDGLAQLSQPPASFQDLFRAEHESEAFHPSLFGGLTSIDVSSSAPALSYSLPFSTPSRPEQTADPSSQVVDSSNNVNGNGGSGRKALTVEQRAEKSAKEKRRRQRLKEVQGIFAPPPKYKKPVIDPITRILLRQNLSPKKRIDLSSPDRSSSAQLRTQDSPFTRILGRSASGLSNELSLTGSGSGSAKKKKSRVSHGQGQDVNNININIDPVYTQDDGYEPSPAQVQELARALVESIAPIPDSQEGEEEINGYEVDAEGEADISLGGLPPTQVKKKRGRPRKNRGVAPAPANATPKRKSILVVEIPSSKKNARVKFDTPAEDDEEEPEPEPETEVVQVESSPEYEPSPEPEEENDLDPEDDEEEEEEGRRSTRRSSTSKRFEKIPGTSGGVSSANARWDRFRHENSLKPTPASTRSSAVKAKAKAKARTRSVEPSSSSAVERLRRGRSVGSASPMRRSARGSVQPSPLSVNRKSTRGSVQPSPSIRRSERRTSSVKPDPEAGPSSRRPARRSYTVNPRPEASPSVARKPKTKGSVRPVVPVDDPEDPQVEDEGEDEYEPEVEGDDEDSDEDQDAGFVVEIESPKIVKHSKTQQQGSGRGLPVDRAKVVIPISKSRRDELISRGHYDAFRDDDSDSESLLHRRAHVSLRPTKLSVQRGSRTIRPSSPEPIPLRFMFRPGPALLEPFASILTEPSLINRLNEYTCHWKGCDSILASEELLKKHVESRGHVRQGKEEVSTERWSWNTRRTTEREVVRGKWFYRCHWKGCEEPCFTSEDDLMQHLTARHLSKVLRCPYEDCHLTSLNISYLSRHVTKQHDSPSDDPLPLADLSVPLHPSSPPAQPLPETARTDELTTSLVLGSAHKSLFYNTKVKEKVASHCFAGPDPIIHVEHPPHMLEIVDDEDDVIDSTGKTKRKGRLEVVVEIPLSKRRKLTEQEKRDRVLRMMNSVEPLQPPHTIDNLGPEERDHDDQGMVEDQDGDSYAYESAPTPWIETDAMMIEDELVLGAPTPAPFSMPWDDPDQDDDEDEAGPSGTGGEEDEDADEEFPLPLFPVHGHEDRMDEEEANGQLFDEGEEEEEDDDLFREFAEAVQAQAQSEADAEEEPTQAQDTPTRPPSIIRPNMSTSVLFSPSIATTSPASNGAPVIQRQGSNSFPFPQARASPMISSLSTAPGGNSSSPLKFGFAERFVASEIPTSTITPTSNSQPEVGTGETSSSKYTGLEEAVQGGLNQEEDQQQRQTDDEDVEMEDEGEGVGVGVIRLNEVQVEILL
ncbi:hypothetical protein I302_100639 [Kwoniella bestiolae CBS 10118]|uniref:ARID domain-containing protein n=1 Tax=Kwoniella bestiolae CBS 10118 TaxID=1296100 RepID=A0A1B9G5P4_9TREE|nr:hypothetical protein I302_04013 [Kwoniella bestiolae CBS 10118]OCF26330.1 hypothetical protein I302_04013 [Kwoniella bestiolae CBS 10118]